ncbi:hypothetical protein D3C75_787160 [compost metagenome]
MLEQQAFPVCTHRAGGQNEFAVFELHNFAAYNPGHVDPACNGQGKYNSPQTRLKYYKQHNYYQQVRNRIQNFGKLVHYSINATTEETHNTTVNNTEDQIDTCGCKTNNERDTGAHPGAYKYVTTKIIRTK